MNNFINTYELIFMNSYCGHLTQGESHKEATSSALWPTGLVICLSIAAFIKGLIQMLGMQEAVNQLALELGIKNGLMSLIVLLSIITGVVLVNVFFKAKINDLNIKYEHINISLRPALAIHFATGMGSMLTFLYVKENALILIILQTVIFSYLANKCVQKST